MPFWASGRAEGALDNRGGLVHAETLQLTPQLHLLGECTPLFEVFTNDVNAHTHTASKVPFPTRSIPKCKLKAIGFPQIFLNSFNTDSERILNNMEPNKHALLKKTTEKGTVLLRVY